MAAFIGLYRPEEATAMEISQLQASGCGVTALMNALVALNIVKKEDVGRLDVSSCVLRSRANNAPLDEYLASRYDAGCTGKELVQSMKQIVSCNGCSPVSASFHSYEQMVAHSQSAFDFIAEQLADGAAVIGTFNLQVFGNDAWHHQLIFGVDTSRRVCFCSNPVEQITERDLNAILSTPSVLLVRRSDVLSRITGSDVLHSELFSQAQWRRLGVAEELSRMVLDPSIKLLTIPAAYVGGVAVFRASTASTPREELASVPVGVVEEDLVLTPLFSCQEDATARYHLDANTSVVVYTRNNKSRVTLDRGADCHSPRLFVDDIWPGSRVLSDYLVAHPTLVAKKSVLELGAGAALPSLVCCKLGASSVVCTDYPLQSVLANIRDVFVANGLLCDSASDQVDTHFTEESVTKVNVNVVGLEWGDVHTCVALVRDYQQFDVILIAEPLWKDTYMLHEALLQTLSHLMTHESTVALLSFAHRPTAEHTPDKDNEFLLRAVSQFGFESKHIHSSSKYMDVGEYVQIEVNIYCLQRK